MHIYFIRMIIVYILLDGYNVCFCGKLDKMTLVRLHSWSVNPTSCSFKNMNMHNSKKVWIFRSILGLNKMGLSCAKLRLKLAFLLRLS